MSTSNDVGLRQRHKVESDKASSVDVSPCKSEASSTSESTQISTNSKEEKTPVVKPILPPEKNFFQKLVTHKEEVQFFHVHKILGLLALISFLYRFSNLGTRDGNFGPNIGTVVFVLHHFLLNASSFIFKLPRQRIQDGGYRIWPEYRIHALIFASRNLAFITLRAYEQYRHPGITGLSPRNFWHMDIILVLVTCALADLASYSQGKYKSSTIRDATFSDPYEQWFASEMQIYLTSFCLVGYRRYTTHLLALWIIQCNSLLMTLRRKNVASHYTLVGCYSLMLLIGFVGICADDFHPRRALVATTFGGVAIILRMGLGLNKYILWTGLGAIWWYIRTSWYTEAPNGLPPWNSMFWLNGLVITRLVAGFLGWRKRLKAPEEQKSKLIGNLVVLIHAGFFGWLYWVNFIARL